MMGVGMEPEDRWRVLLVVAALLLVSGLARAQSPTVPTNTPTATPTATASFTPTNTFTPHRPIRGRLGSLPGETVEPAAASSHRQYLGRVPEGASTVVVASFFDSAPTPIPAIPDAVDCWVWRAGVDPAQVSPLFVCDTIEDPATADVAVELSPLATQVVDPNSTSTERHRIQVFGDVDGVITILEALFDVIANPGLVVDPVTGVPGPVLPATPTPGS